MKKTIAQGEILGETVYGPVPSWRFGRSLGIDLTPPPKLCTFNCIYCQLGPTRRPVRDPREVQGELPSAKQVARDLKAYLKRVDTSSLDVVTFSGSGEPTLNLQLGLIAREIRGLVGGVPLVLLTNGSLLTYPGVLEGLSQLDIVTVKFDAGDDEALRFINRPVLPFSHAQLVKGIHRLHSRTQVTVALEVMLLETTSGISNVRGEAREKLKEGIARLGSDVDLVQIYTPWRPPSERRVRPVSVTVLRRFAEELSEVVGQEKLWVYGVHDARGKEVSWRLRGRLEEEILAMLRRRPCRLVDLALALNLPLPSILRKIVMLIRRGAVSAKMHSGEKYYFAPQGN